MARNIGDRIRSARERRHLTQEQLGVQVGVSLRTVGNWERGESVPRNRRASLEDILGISLDPDVDPDQHTTHRVLDRAGAEIALYEAYGAGTDLARLAVLQERMRVLTQRLLADADRDKGN